MLFLRSLLFNIAFYVNLTIVMVVGLPTMLSGRAAILDLARVWGRADVLAARQDLRNQSRISRR